MALYEGSSEYKKMRIEIVARLICQGLSPAEIHSVVTMPRAKGGEYGWDVAYKTACEYVSDAKSFISSQYDFDEVKDIIAMQCAKIDEIYRLSVKSKNYKAALGCIKEKNELLGLYKAREIHIRNINQDDLVPRSEESVRLGMLYFENMKKEADIASRN